MGSNIEFLICIIIIILVFIVHIKSRQVSEHFTVPVSEEYRTNKISNPDITTLNKFFSSLNLTFCPYSIFDYNDPEIKNNKKINKKNKKINKKYAKFLCYKNNVNKLPKLYIKYISNNIGFGLFADQNFTKDDYIGEFAGTITTNPDPSSDNYNYCYIDDTDIVIAPRKNRQ